MNTITINTLKKMKKELEKIACLTAYDASFTQILCQAGIDVILVGDSLGNVIQGSPTTVPVRLDDILYHVRCVTRHKERTLIMGDMPFMTYATTEQALQSATQIMQAGAEMVKMEGGSWLSETVYALTERGIPVCAHIGLTPQAVHQLGGFRFQGQNDEEVSAILNAASDLEQAGASLLVLEYIPSSLSEIITRKLSIPTIGVGAGLECDGQIVVLYDILGITPGKTPLHACNFLTEQPDIQHAISAYIQAVKQGSFPQPENWRD